MAFALLDCCGLHATSYMPIALHTHHSAYVLTSASLKSADRSTTLRCLGSALMIFCVVACGKQQKTASTLSKLTSSIFVRVSQSAEGSIMGRRCGKTSAKDCR
eukprot:GHUV01046584.1.p1 GENE.GHUV01046584.1~~GHUV01046584.1.p1  ORF type:complete len:103 (+),score=13.96 GHUV01046584.1:524-832(+)